MLARLVQFSLSQRLFISLLTIGLAIAGWLAFRGLPIDAFPDVSPTQVKIIIKAPGMTAEEVESRITQPIEVEMLGIPQQAMLRSMSKYGIVDITVDFDDGTNLYWARQQVSERLANLWDDLPLGISGGMAANTTPLGEMFMFTIEGGELSLMERRSLLDWVIRPALRTVPGVADVNALGGEVRSFEVIPNASQLAAVGLSVNILAELIQANNRNDGAGSLSEGEEVLLVRSEGGIQSLDDLRGVVVKADPPVRLGEVAEVRIGSLTRYGAVTQNGQGEVVEGLVLGLGGANAREVVDGVRNRLAEIQPSLPKGVHVSVFYDRANLVNQAVSTVSWALLEAVALVLVLLTLFLGNLRAALAVALVLPLAALTTFLCMRWFGISANLMSLGGLAVAIGMLVDAAVVVVENTVEHLSHDRLAKRLPRLHVIYRSVREVAVPVTSGILIIIMVFLPLLTLQGLEGKLFAPVALTIVFALAGSLLLSLTAIPVLSSYLLGQQKQQEPLLMRGLQKLYNPALQWTLRHPRSITVVALLLLALGAGVYTQIGKTFMPSMDEGDLIVQIEKLPSVTLEQSIALDLKIQQAILSQVPEVKRVVGRVGSDELGLDPMGLNDTDTFLIFKPRSEWRMRDKQALMDHLRQVLNTMPGINYQFSQPIDMRVSEMVIGVRGDLAVKVFGDDLDQINSMASQVETLLKTIPGAEDVYLARNEGQQYLQVNVDRLAAGRLGFTVDQVQDALRAQIEGRHLGVVIEAGRRSPLLLRGPESLRLSPADFTALRLTAPNGESVALASIAHIERAEGPVRVEREMGSRYSVVTANVRGRDLVGFVEEAKARVGKQLALPTGYRITWGGEFENQQRAAARLSLVVPIALGLIFLLLFVTFGSVRQTLLVFSNIPFAMVGGIIALWASGEYLSVPASVGFIALLGIAVLNGVVMVSYFNQLHAKGLAISEVVVQGAKRRLRPVMMTASITAFGLVPLLFASGPGSEIQRPLAIVVIGGLITATALTLIILPLLYQKFAFAKQERSHG